MSKLAGMIKTMKRAYNRAYTVFVSKRMEQARAFNENEKLKYLLFKKTGSDALIVGFQACNNDGAFYNYVSTVKGFRASRLFIKDDFAEDGLGDYYLGHGGDFSVEKAVFDLIDQTARQLGARKLIFIGSSKGGYAAINFGVHYPRSTMIVAAPQYFLGQYLLIPRYKVTLKDVLGENPSDQQITMLDERLRSKLAADALGPEQSLYIHYSTGEDTYNRHIRFLVEDAKKAGIAVHEDVGDYKEHWQLKYYFPDYLKQTLRETIGE